MIDFPEKKTFPLLSLRFQQTFFGLARAILTVPFHLFMTWQKHECSGKRMIFSARDHCMGGWKWEPVTVNLKLRVVRCDNEPGDYELSSAYKACFYF